MLIHPSHQPEARRALRDVVILLIASVAVWLVPRAAIARNLADYGALHAVLEILSVVAAGMVFAITLSVRREHLSRSIVLLGGAFLGVALLDLAHLMASPGMPGLGFVGVFGADIYFGLVERAMAVLALLAVAWLPWRTCRRAWVFPALIGGVVALVIGVLAAPELPLLFVPGRGLSPFKIASEYALMAVNLAVAARLWWMLRRPRTFDASGLFAAACMLVEGGFFFAVYSHAGGPLILLAHVCKVLAYAYVYRAVFVDTVRRPYQLLDESREHLRTTMDALPDPMFEIDDTGRYVAVHTSHPGQLAAGAVPLVGRTLHEVLTPESAAVVRSALDEAERLGVSRGKVMSVDTRAGGRRWFELSVAHRRVGPGGEPRFIVISRDITEHRRIEANLVKFSAAVAQSPVSIIITDPRARVEYVNDAFTRTTGYTFDEVAGRDVQRLLQSRDTPEPTVGEMTAAITRGDAWRGEVANTTRAGRNVVQRLLIYPLRDVEGAISHYLVHQEDVTEQKVAAERIQQLAHYDALTGLPNRTMLSGHFDAGRQRGRDLAVVWLDIDRFKDINDSLGHRLGDLLLQAMASRLRSLLGAEDLLVRYVGDAFVVILPDSDQASAAAIAQALLAAAAQPQRLAGEEVFVTASAGIALYPDDADALDGLLAKAEIAMYRAKDAGRNQACFFTPELQQRTSRIVTLGNALKQAQARGELSLVYQPQVALDDAHVLGAEVLLRWHSPQWGEIGPAEFIPIAEANGLIVPIGEWVLRSALAQWCRWLAAGLPRMVLAVNLSAVQFNQPDLAARVVRAIELAGLPRGCLELELTEAVAMRTPTVAARRMEELRAHDVRLAIDDFGTGYSSLSYLKQFNVNRLKIDQSFVRDIGSDPDDQAITIAIIQMARSLGVRTIAEGVETAAQWAFLRAHGCEQGQGYHFSHPLPPDRFERYVRDRMPAAIASGHPPLAK